MAKERSHKIRSKIKELEGHRIPLHEFSEFHPAVIELLKKTWKSAGLDPKIITDLTKKIEFIKDEQQEFSIPDDVKSGLKRMKLSIKFPIINWKSSIFSNKIIASRLTDKPITSKERVDLPELKSRDITSVIHELLHKIIQEENPGFLKHELKENTQRATKLIGEVIGQEGRKDRTDDLNVILVLIRKSRSPEQLKKIEELGKILGVVSKGLSQLEKISEGAATYGTELVSKIIGDRALIRAEEKNMAIYKSGIQPHEEYVEGHKFFKTIIEKKCSRKKGEKQIDLDKRRLRELIQLIRNEDLKTDKDLEGM